LGFCCVGLQKLISLPYALSLGQCQCSIIWTLLSVCFDGLLIVFQFCRVVWLWMLLTGSGGELCGSLSAFFQAEAYHWSAVIPSAFPAFVYWRFTSLLLPSSLVCLQHSASSAACVFSSLFIVQFWFLFLFFLVGQGSVCLGGYAFLSQRWLGEYHRMLGAHLWVCQMSPKQVWSWCFVAWEPSCFLSVTLCEKLCMLQGVKVLILLGALFLPSVAPVSQQDFWFMEHTLSLHPSYHPESPSRKIIEVI
jgi:hypothetical protein